jgi:hypothetical protein
METALHRNQSDVIETRKTNVKSEFWEIAEFNRYGIVPWLLVFVVAIGATSAALTIEGGWKLGVIVISTILVEASALSLMSMRSLVIGSAISVSLNLLMIFI